MEKKIIIGLIAGIISGFFSTGGGMILVPAFIHLLKINQIKSRATSVACILPMVITTSFFYAKNDYIDWKIAIFCAIGGIVGGFFGAKILKKIPVNILKISFIVFLLYAGFSMLEIF